MKGRAIPYSAAEMAWLEENRAMIISDYHRAFVTRFGRDDVSLVNLHSLRKRKGWKVGRTGRFEKGQSAHNKGKSVPSHPNSRKTQFKKGNLTGMANRNYKPLGTERISKDGYRERKVHDGLPLQSRWQAVHRIEWEAAHGAIPKDMALKCIDGNKLDTNPSNWKLVPRAILPRLAGANARQYVAYDSAPAALKPALLAVAELEHGIREQRRGGADRWSSPAISVSASSALPAPAGRPSHAFSAGPRSPAGSTARSAGSAPDANE